MKEDILKLRDEGLTYNQIVERLGCSKGTVSYWCGAGQRQKARNRNNALREKYGMLHKVEHFKSPGANRSKRRVTSTTDPKKLFRFKSYRFQSRDGESGTTYFNHHDVIEKFGIETNCYLSGRPVRLDEPATYQFDHIIPAARGGSNDLDNLGIACSQFNRMKSDLTVPEFLEACKEILEFNGYEVRPVIPE